MSIEDSVSTFFDKRVTDRERAIFEGAIALGAISHQFIGVPICNDKNIIKSLEETIEKTMKLQPYRERVKVKIDADMISKEKNNPYDYETLRDRHLDLQVITSYGKARVTVRMRYIPEIDFSLMYIERIEEL